jgi:CheY-like chemotaxis protein
MPTALVVDDEADARAFVRAILKEEGWEVAEAANGQEGLRNARALLPDLVVLDISMPEVNGLTVFNELMQDPDTAHLKVIMLTAVSETTGIEYSAESMGWFFGKEPAAYLEKPVSPEAFKRTLKRVTEE